MKKELIILAAAFALAGCNEQGSTGTEATIDTGSGSSSISISTNDGADVNIRGSATGAGSVSGSGTVGGSITNTTAQPNAGGGSSPQ